MVLKMKKTTKIIIIILLALLLIGGLGVFYIKNSLKPGSIISFNINSETVKELPSIITYIKQKGYTLVTLDQLINEKYYSEK